MTNEPLLLLSEAAELLYVSEDHFDMVGVVGSIPIAPTNKTK